MATATIAHGNTTYTATLEDDRVSITEDGVHVGSGRWNGRAIYDCPADLGDEVYEALDAALTEATLPTRPIGSGEHAFDAKGYANRYDLTTVDDYETALAELETSDLSGPHRAEVYAELAHRAHRTAWNHHRREAARRVVQEAKARAEQSAGEALVWNF